MAGRAGRQVLHGVIAWVTVWWRRSDVPSNKAAPAMIQWLSLSNAGATQGIRSKDSCRQAKALDYFRFSGDADPVLPMPCQCCDLCHSSCDCGKWPAPPALVLPAPSVDPELLSALRSSAGDLTEVQLLNLAVAAPGLRSLFGADPESESELPVFLDQLRFFISTEIQSDYTFDTTHASRLADVIIAHKFSSQPLQLTGCDGKDVRDSDCENVHDEFAHIDLGCSSDSDVEHKDHSDSEIPIHRFVPSHYYRGYDLNFEPSQV